jgi:hypothetical protein
MSATIVLLIGLAGLAAVALLLVREPDRRVRVATIAGAAGGFLLALLLAIALGTDTWGALATATLGAAVLSLSLIGQWRLFRTLFARSGRRL